LSDRRFHIPIHCIRVAVEGFAFPIPAMTRDHGDVGSPLPVSLSH
jgi:hypothetical protein